MTKDAQFALRRGGRGCGRRTAPRSEPGPDTAPRAVIEKYTRNARFCLICNYVSKIIPALQSRCTRFRFPPLAEEFVRERLQHVVDAEGCGPARPASRAQGLPDCPTADGRRSRVAVEEAGMDALVTLGCGDMRRSLNILQAGLGARAGARRRPPQG